MKVFFTGAGAGDPELITVKAERIIEKADIIIYAGSLVNPEILNLKKPGSSVFDSSGMNLIEITAIYMENRNSDGTIVRLHSGDPSLYSSIQEQIIFCRQNNINFEIIPGISSFQAASAALEQELTLPGITQTVILSRISGRTPVPKREDISLLAKHRCSLVLFLSVDKIEQVVEKLLSGYSYDTPVSVVYRASWANQKIVCGTLKNIAARVKKTHINRQALIFVGDVLRVKDETSILNSSKLYDPAFSHSYRQGNSKDMEVKS